MDKLLHVGDTQPLQQILSGFLSVTHGMKKLNSSHNFSYRSFLSIKNSLQLDRTLRLFVMQYYKYFTVRGLFRLKVQFIFLPQTIS